MQPMTDTDTEQQAPPEQRIKLGDDMGLLKRGDVLAVEHARLAEPQIIDEAQLVRWLRRQLREIF